KAAYGHTFDIMPAGNNTFIASENNSLLLIKGMQMTNITLPDSFRNARIGSMLPYTSNSIIANYTIGRDNGDVYYFIYDLNTQTLTGGTRIANRVFSVRDSNTFITSRAVLPRRILHLHVSGRRRDSVVLFQSQVCSRHSDHRQLFLYF